MGVGTNRMNKYTIGMATQGYANYLNKCFNNKVSVAIAHDCRNNSRAFAEITANVSIPTIGIGAGAACSGQVLVLHDMLDIYPGKKARFVKNYMQGAHGIADGVTRYVIEVKSGAFPGVEHSF